MDDRPQPSPVRRPPPTAVGCLTAIVGLLTLGTVAAAAMGSVLFASEIEKKKRELTAEFQGKLLVREELDSAGELLKEVSLHVRRQRAERGEFPRRPTEALPDDPWGTPLEYERIHPQHARLRSAGPDRHFGTGDDIESVIE